MNEEAVSIPEPPVAPPPPRPYPRFWQAFRLLLTLAVLQIALFLVVRIAGATRGDPAVGACVELLAYGIVFRRGLRRTAAPASNVFPLRAFRPGLVIATVLTFAGFGLLILEVGYLFNQALPKPESFRAIERESDIGVFGPLRSVLMAPILEELLNRGLILRGFLGAYSRPRAVFLSALLFGLFHLNPWQILPAFGAGLLLGWWRVGTGSLWPCIAGHMLWNGLIAAGRAFLPPPPHPLPEFPVSDQLMTVGFGVILLGTGLLLWRRSATRGTPLPAGGAAPI